MINAEYIIYIPGVQIRPPSIPLIVKYSIE